MEIALSTDDSCDQDSNSLKTQLTEFGLEEDNLCKEEMVNLLKVLKYSKTTVQQEQIEEVIPLKKKEETSNTAAASKIMKRRYPNVKDRRMPWSLIPSTLGPAEKARTLAVYIKLMSINNYRQARQTFDMTAWAQPIQIIESTRIQPLRSTRSGRSVPLYADLDDDDSSDFDCMITKTKRRKISNNEQNDTKKCLTLKRKICKDENIRPVKEAKVNELRKVGEDPNFKVDLYSIIED